MNSPDFPDTAVFAHTSHAHRSPWSTEPILELSHVSAHYPALDPGADDKVGPAQIHDVNLTLNEGEILLVVGRTGSGKSTLLGTITGQMPHTTGGLLRGEVKVVGRDTRDYPPRLLSDVIGVVGQDPLAGFVTTTVEEELAYGMEQLGLSQDIMRKRVEETLDLLGLAELRGVPLTDLSGGEQQRVAIGAVLTTRPALLVLDEPTSALDPNGAEDVLATITKLAHDLGMTVVLAEHRIERVLGYVDKVAHIGADGTVTVDKPERVMEHSDVAPPLIELGRWAGWSPLPLSIREARAQSAELRRNLYGRGLVVKRTAARDAAVALRACDIVVDYPEIRAVDGVSFSLHAGEITALMGRNGCGKSSLLWALQGTGKRTLGQVGIAHGTGGFLDPAALKPATRRELVSMVPQTPTDILYSPTVAEELAQADRDAGAPEGTTENILSTLVPNIQTALHPRDLSEGQKLALALSIQLAARPAVLLFDEPTRGLDYDGKKVLARLFGELAMSGRAILVVTHDVEFAALCADRVLFMAGGKLIADGPAVDILAASPAYAPQVAKVTAGVHDPSQWLTVSAVQACMTGLV